MTPLEASIAHWRENESVLHWEDAQLGSHHCALCQTYRACDGCPVAAATGEEDCHDSPYYDAQDAYDAWRLTVLLPPHWVRRHHPWLDIWRRREAFLLAARDERLFLESLLESNHV